MQKRVSTLIGIIIIVVAAIIFFGGVLAYQYFSTKANNTQTAGWKTYTNTPGLQFKIPSTLSKADFSDDNNLYFISQEGYKNYKDAISQCAKAPRAPDMFGVGCYISAMQNFSDLIIYTAPMQLAVKANEVINGISWERDYPSAYGTGTYMYSTDNSGTSYQLVSANEKFLLQVISTVKFTAPTDQTVQPSITVLSPNGGETVEPGQHVKITWNVDSNYPNVQVMVVAGKAADGQYTNNGSMASFRGYVIYTGSNTGSFEWTVPTGFPGAGNYLIRSEPQTSNGQASGQIDYSANYFTIK